jgi:hypothetical protein
MLSSSNEYSSIGDNGGLKTYYDDFEYVSSLGLIKRDCCLTPANPLYATAIAGYIGLKFQPLLAEHSEFQLMDCGTIDMKSLLAKFQVFFVKKSEALSGNHMYAEAAPYLLLTAFLGRMFNGKAIVINEYVSGEIFSDIIVMYGANKYLLRLVKKKHEKTKDQGFRRILAQMNKFNVCEGWILNYEVTPPKNQESGKISWRSISLSEGKTIHEVAC